MVGDLQRSGIECLEEQVNISNQNVKAAEAQFREARYRGADRAFQPLPHRYGRSALLTALALGYRRGIPLRADI